MNPVPISTYQKTRFSAPLASGHEVSHDVYRRGAGPVIVLIQELPGIGKETLALADRLVEAGFQVALPHLFGPLGKLSLIGNTLRVFCMRREFRIFSANKSSPLVDWLKALCQHLRTETGTSGVGVIGMCLTGNFAMSLMADDSVLAAVASQPSLPVIKGNSLHMSEEELRAVKTGLETKGPMLAFRFEEDKLCPPERFEQLKNRLNDGAQTCVELHTIPGKGHAVLTLDFVDEQRHPTRKALERVLAYFSEKLKGDSPSPSSDF